MPGIVQTNVDTAVGIIRPLQTSFNVGGEPAGVVGCSVDAHPPCETVPIHCTATMAEGVEWFKINGVSVCVEGNAATCGDTATGQEWFTIG